MKNRKSSAASDSQKTAKTAKSAPAGTTSKSKPSKVPSLQILGLLPTVLHPFSNEKPTFSVAAVICSVLSASSDGGGSAPNETVPPVNASGVADIVKQLKLSLCTSADAGTSSFAGLVLDGATERARGSAGGVDPNAGALDRIHLLSLLLFPQTARRGWMRDAVRGVSPDDCYGDTTKAYWRVLLHKSTNALALLLASLRSDSAQSDERVASRLLTLLYNILRNAPRKHQARYVHQCDKLGLLKACSGILRRCAGFINESTLTQGGDKAMDCLRAAEAAALLSALCSVFIPRVSVVVRLSRDLSQYARVLEVAAKGWSSVLRGVATLPTKRTETSVEQWASAVKTPTLRLSLPCANLLLSLFVLTKSVANAQEIGRVGASLCSTVIETSYSFLRDNSATLRDSADHSKWVSSWVKHLEGCAFWATALLQRLCFFARSKKDVAVQAHARHVLEPLISLTTSPPSDASSPSPAFPSQQLHRTALLCVFDLINCKRDIGVASLEPLGGLQALVTAVLLLDEPDRKQWHNYYLRLAAIYGVDTLPTSPDDTRPGCFIDLRIPRRTVTANESRLNTEADIAGLSSSTPEGPVGTSNDSAHQYFQLLPVDADSSSFSPELSSSTDTASLWSDTTNAAHGEGALDSFFYKFSHGEPPAYTCGTDDASHAAPLCATSEEERINVLKHQIKRLVHLQMDAASGRPRYHVVYERPGPGAGAGAAAASASSPKQVRGDGAQANNELRFFSDFESGNLQRAVKVSDDEYDLVLAWDTASNTYTQWFYFAFEGYTPGRKYRFNIVNMEKRSSTFNEGQRVLQLFVPDSPGGADGQEPAAPCWKRAGENIFYYQTPYKRPDRDFLFTKSDEPDKVLAAATGSSNQQQQLFSSNGSAASSPPETHAQSSANPKEAASKRKSRDASPAPPAKKGAKKTAKKVKKAKTPKTAASKASPDVFYYGVSFELTAPAEKGRVYLCNCFPFTYSDLRAHLTRTVATAPSYVRVRMQELCPSLGGVAVPFLTVTSRNSTTADGSECGEEEMRRRPVCFLVARVHPGESNASWVMKGILDFLLGSSAAARSRGGGDDSLQRLLSSFVFKIVPMINVDGVIMGNHRCSLAGADLNRDYTAPVPELNPVLYSLKRYMGHVTKTEGRKIIMFSDFHGHSRATNFLMYGCTQVGIERLLRKVRLVKRDTSENGDNSNNNSNNNNNSSATPPASNFATTFAPEKFFSAALRLLCPPFDLKQSSFSIQKDKRHTGRVVMYREFGIRMSYAVESTMMGGSGASFLRAGRPSTPAVASGSQTSEPSHDDKVPTDVDGLATHYDTLCYSRFGECYLRCLLALLTLESDLRDNATSPSTEAVELAWSMLVLAGPGSAAPSLPAVVASASIAGNYAAATRLDRRSSANLDHAGDDATWGTPRTPASVAAASGSGLTSAEKSEVIHSLLRGEQLRLGDSEDDEDDTEADADGGEESDGADDGGKGDEEQDGEPLAADNINNTTGADKEDETLLADGCSSEGDDQSCTDVSSDTSSQDSEGADDNSSDSDPIGATVLPDNIMSL